jgi:hypothetical protein
MLDVHLRLTQCYLFESAECCQPRLMWSSLPSKLGGLQPQQRQDSGVHATFRGLPSIHGPTGAGCIAGKDIDMALVRQLVHTVT